MDSLTVFTPAFNRAYTLPRLYDSLCSQKVFEFEWIIVDDGSTDGTRSLVEGWLTSNTPFQIRYFFLDHGGKQRAINFAVKKASFPFFFIVDSDDVLTPDAISKVLKWCKGIETCPDLAGVSGVRGTMEGRYRSEAPMFNGEFIDASNLDRAKYGLGGDMAEIFKTELLKKYPYPVWPDETFTPESVIWNRIALDGYKIRWHKDIIYLCDYLEDGLTKAGYSLYLQNLMGCAMASDMRARVSNSFRKKVSAIIETDVACCLKGEYRFLPDTCNPILSFLFLPYSWMLSIYRKMTIFKHLR